MSFSGPILIVLAVAVAFFPCLGNAFTNWDDLYFINENPAVQNFSIESIRSIFTSRFALSYCPLTMTGIALQNQVWGPDSFGFHLTSYLFHIINAILAWFLVFRLERNTTTATLATLFFAIHPLRVEPVAWVTSQKDLLFSFFLILSCHSWLTYRESPSAKNYFFSGMFFAASLFSKGMAITIPLIFLLFEFRETKPIGKRKILELLPFFLASICFSAIIAGDAKSTGNFDRAYYFLIASGAFQLYLLKTLIPTGLSALIPFPPGGWNGLGVSFYIAPVTLILGTVGFVYFGYRRRGQGFWGLFFLLNTLPFLQFVPFGGTAMAADRFTYLPGLGLGALFAIFLLKLFETGSRMARTVLPVFAGSLILCLAVLTWNRCQVWGDSITLWNDVLEKYPEDPSGIALSNRGAAWLESGKYDEALSDIRNAIRVNPTLVQNWVSLGVIMTERKQMESAEEAFNKAITIDPENPKPRTALGEAFFRTGNFEKSLQAFELARKLAPNDPRILNSIGTVFHALDRKPEAIAVFDRAISLSPHYAEALNNRGSTLRSVNRLEESLADINRALKLKPDNTAFFLNRLRTYKKMGMSPQVNDGMKFLKNTGVRIPPDLASTTSDY